MMCCDDGWSRISPLFVVPFLACTYCSDNSMYIFCFCFFACASKKWQNNQRIDGGRILVEVEVDEYAYMIQYQSYKKSRSCSLFIIMGPI
jgi:hypothetical protein